MQPGTGALYPLRWGAVEPPSADAVENVWGSPTYPGATCVKRNSKLGIYIDWEGGPTAQWKVLDAWLESQLTAQLYFDEGPDSHGWHNANQTHWFAVRVPDFVDWSKIRGSIITYSPSQRSQTWSYENDVYTILDQPKAPMNPGWASYLPYVCKWARYRPDSQNVDQHDAITTNFDDATMRTTFGLYYQRPGLAYPQNSGTYWVDGNADLHLRSIINSWLVGYSVSANCLDTACVNMCAINSLGLDFSTRGLTGDLDPNQFHTNSICLIGSDPTADSDYVSKDWAWHRLSIPTGEPFNNTARVWDNTSASKYDLAGSQYRNPVAYYPPGNQFWPQKDYWQKSNGSGGWLGLVATPIQQASSPGSYQGDWKCGVTTVSWP